MSRFRDYVLGIGSLVVIAAVVWILSIAFGGLTVAAVYFLLFLLAIVTIFNVMMMLIGVFELLHPDDQNFMNFDIGDYNPFEGIATITEKN